MEPRSRASSPSSRVTLDDDRTLLAIGVAAAVIATAVWVLITARADGATTYHLFPLLIGASSGATAGYMARRPLRGSEAIALAFIGFAAVLAGWVLLAAIDRWPSGVYSDAIPAGIEGETLLLALAGAVAGGLYAYFRPSRSLRGSSSV